MKITLIGPPGSGKGTQAVRLKEKYAVPHISSGDVLRSEVAGGTDFGKQIKQYMDKGEIGPVELITKVILNYLKENCKSGFIFDGFPRTVYQGEELGKIETLHAAIFITVSEDEIIKRITGRRSCNECKNIFHVVYNPPQKEGICDNCGAELVQRSDDNEKTVINRIRVYNEETKPVIEFYEKQGLLHKINGERNPDDIFKDITAVLS
ncbi:MAG: adenylate kinase [bacterium]|nr:adenylate kinase [bacterium]